MSSSCAVSSSIRSELLTNPFGRKYITPSKTYHHQTSTRMEMLPLKPEGYNFWTWRGHQIHYVEQGQATPIVLIHGFGASAFHWRYSTPELAKNYKVYGVNLLGFGWSEKALIDYDAMIWRDLVVDFMKCLGGFTALISAADLADQVVGVALLNSAFFNEEPIYIHMFCAIMMNWIFGGANPETEQVTEESGFQKFLLKPLKEAFQRVVVGIVFWPAKQPARVKSVLKSLSCPLLLLWGDLDHWVGPAKANQIKEFYRKSSLQVNGALVEWLSSLKIEPCILTV
ncbi:hypothetical protein MKX03_023553 [Papaver bracteatum]|nr:hypothetical protein MKX03_023553 [Papaver bracteatum]